jgi:hypothetical protein
MRRSRVQKRGGQGKEAVWEEEALRLFWGAMKETRDSLVHVEWQGVHQT